MSQTNENTVLVIEDDRNTAALVALYLKREGFRALTAGAFRPFPFLCLKSLYNLYTLSAVLV